MDVDEKILLIKKNLQEVTDEDILRKIVAARPLKIYWGTAITGKPHIAYYLPLMKIRDFVKAGCTVKILLADIHGFLDNLKAPIEKISIRIQYYEKLIKAALACLGVDLSSVEFVKGSDYQLSKGYTFDLYKLSSYTTIHDAVKAGTQVVKQAQNPLLSSLLYPNMQALDEQYLDVDAQFGGIDQRKIFMHARAYMPKIGYKRRIYLMNPMMPGLNSEKMSSSDETSKIDFLDTKSVIEKKIRKCFCEPGNINTGILTIYKHILFPIGMPPVTIGDMVCKEYDELEKAYAEGAIHPGDLKTNCAEQLERIVAPVRDELMKNPELLKSAY